MRLRLTPRRHPSTPSSSEVSDDSSQISPARRHRRRQRRIMYGVSLALFVVSIYFHITNPFVRFTVVEQPFEVLSDQDHNIWLTETKVLRVRENRLSQKIAEFKCGYHILSNVISGSQKARATNTQEIIADIHALRFNPQLPFLISGDHFSVLYPRSLGIFYHSLLDPRTALNPEDWFNRQALYLKTTAYALESFKNAANLTTTITPVGPQSVSLVNFHRPPSDTLYSLLYALERLKSADTLETIYPFPADAQSPYVVNTAHQADQLLAQYSDSLRRHLATYSDFVYDQQTGLIKKDLLLSSTKDATMRSSAFYDNVIYWKTYQLAGELGIVEVDQQFLTDLKQRILTTFWAPEVGIFLEDLSPAALEQHIYSSDWLIAYMTGFLDPANPEEQEYLVRSLEYIDKTGINRPFALWYQDKTYAERQYPLLRVFAPSYGSSSIWSHWGMEYIKLIARLYQLTGDERYLKEAQYQIAAYTQNIKTYQGYPELYDTRGKMYQRLVYKSVRQTGWVVNFEEAEKMVNSLTTFYPAASDSAHLPEAITSP